MFQSVLRILARRLLKFASGFTSLFRYFNNRSIFLGLACQNQVTFQDILLNTITFANYLNKKANEFNRKIHLFLVGALSLNINFPNLTYRVIFLHFYYLFQKPSYYCKYSKYISKFEKFSSSFLYRFY